MKKIICYLLLLSVMGGISCNKDTTATNVQSALSDKKWMLVSIKVNGLDVTNDFLDTCDLDNFNVYATNNILELHQGIIKCDVSDPDILYTNWKLLGNDKFIEQDSVIYYLTHLDENNLILGFSDFVENIKYRKF